MKTKKPFLIPALCCAFLSLSSCQRDEVRHNDAASLLRNDTVEQTANTPSDMPATGYCSVVSKSLCSSGLSLGSLTVKRGKDSKVYVTYKGTENWYIAQLNLYAGDALSIPSSMLSFPYKKTFGYPFSVQEYTFALNSQPSSFKLAGYAILVKKLANGSITSVKAAWADGCSGERICHHGNYSRGFGSEVLETGCGDLEDATLFTYEGAACTQ